MKATLAGNGERVTLTENRRDLGHGLQIEIIYQDGTTGWAHSEDLIDRDIEEDDSLTYDVVFNDDNDSNNKGFKYSFEDAKGYINSYNGTNESYFEDYKGGVVSIVCNETGETVFETEVLQKKRYNYFYNGVAIPRNQFVESVPSSWENEVNEYGEYSHGYYRAVEK